MNKPCKSSCKTRRSDIFWLFFCVIILSLFVCTTIPGSNSAQRAAWENNCVKKLTALISEQKEQFSQLASESETFNSLSNKDIILPLLKKVDYIEHFKTIVCADEFIYTKASKSENSIPPCIILAIPMQRADFNVLYFFKANFESRLRTFAINQDSELFYKLGDPIELTCDNINLHSKDEWAQIPTE